ncbi:hypothetical protein CRYUN_Cryun04dG0026300 [Craigia yunnanensis]
MEKTDRGIFDFMKKKYEDVAMADAHKPDNTKKVEKSTIMEKLHRSIVYEHFLRSSDEEEVGEDGEKKGLKEKIKEKISGDEEATEHKDTSIPTENPEKKGFLDKIKEKLPGQHKKTEDSAYDGHPDGGKPKEKEILEKIKEKIPGCHGHKTEEDKPKEN